MNKNEWLDDRVKHLKGLKSRNEQQDELVKLAEKPDRTAYEEKKLNAIIESEKASIVAAKKKQKAAKFLADDKKAEAKKQRADETRRKILLGALASDMMDKDEAAKHRFLEKLDKFLTRNDDRALFGFNPVIEQPKR